MTPVASLPAAGRDLDALVAEKIFGWPHEQMLVGTGADYDVMHLEPPRAAYRRRSHVDGFWERWSPTGAEVIVSDTVPPYSTDIAAAWEVVEKLQHGGPRETYWWSLETPWIEPPNLYVARILEGSVEIARGEAPSMAESICVAALKAVAP